MGAAGSADGKLARLNQERARDIGGGEEAMGRPAMTEEQWQVAATMLANALRKVDRFDGARSAGDDLMHAVAAGRRAESAEAYARGMVDLLAVLFEGGRPAAERLAAAAQAMARRDGSEDR
jgi:hypothetical protein